MEDTEESNDPVNYSRTALTGNKDTDLIVLSKLTDKDLLNACLTNKTINKACYNESFWRQRFIDKFDKKYVIRVGYDYPSKYKKDSETWRDFYLKFVHYSNKYRMANYLLRIACFKGDLSLVVYTLNNNKSQNLEIDTEDNLPLITAVEGGFDDIIKYLINHGAPLDSRILPWLSGYGSFDIIKFVIEKGADVTASNNKSIRIAANVGRFDIVYYLIDNGAYMHANNDEILLHAARLGNVKMIKYLLNNGANINRTEQKFHPLSDAIQNGEINAAKYLIEAGADVNIKNGLPLRMAIKIDNLDIMKDLIEHGADINIEFTEDGNKFTPLKFAKTQKAYEIYQYLKSEGAN